MLGAIQAQNYLGGDAVVVTILSDSNKKYLSTDLMRTEPVKQEYLSPDIELVDFQALKRVCHVCCDLDDCDQKLEPEQLKVI